MPVSAIWVLCEPTSSGVTTTSLELLAAARALATRVEAVSWGPSTAANAEVLGAHGAATVHDVGDVHGRLPGVPVAAAMAALVQRAGAPDAILVPTSYDGRDVAARLSVRLDRPVLTNVTGLTDEGGALVSEHPVFGGSLTVRARFTGEPPGIFVIRAKSFAPEPAGSTAAAVAALEVPETGATGSATVDTSHAEERTGPSLDEAGVVVSGGRGLGDASAYPMIEELASLLHGAAGASRAIVDAGWVPYSHQVGQTGKTVKPDVYLAFGISGATQHLVGMKGSRAIVAVNKDRDAPIFTIADLGIVGDVHRVLPALIDLLKNR